MRGEGAGTDNSNEINFEHHKKLLSLWSFTIKFRRSALNSEFTLNFHAFIHVYSPRTGAYIFE